MLDLIIDANGDLQLVLRDDAKEWIDTDRLRNLPTDSALVEMLEDYLQTDWDWINPADIGALTSAPMISNDAEYDDDMVLQDGLTVWYHERYAVEDPIEMLLNGETVTFNKA